MSATAPSFPEVLGTKEVAELLGVATSNLKSISGLPEPVSRVSATKLWLAEDILPFAEEYHQRRMLRLHRR